MLENRCVYIEEYVFNEWMCNKRKLFLFEMYKRIERCSLIFQNYYVTYKIVILFYINFVINKTLYSITSTIQIRLSGKLSPGWKILLRIFLLFLRKVSS